MPVDASALILAGGRATRMGGVAKHALVVDGETILARQTRVLAPRVREILVAAPAELAGYRCVRDVPEAVGPLAGIAAGLAAATTPWLLVLAGDMPHVSGAVLDRMLARAVTAGDAVGLRVGDLPEPLLCLLRVAPARAAVDALVAARRFKAAGLLAALAVAWLDEAELRALDPALRSLHNVNAPGDL